VVCRHGRSDRSSIAELQRPPLNSILEEWLRGSLSEDFEKP
jgi:hypothetical protein